MIHVRLRKAGGDVDMEQDVRLGGSFNTIMERPFVPFAPILTAEDGMPRLDTHYYETWVFTGKFEDGRAVYGKAP